MGLTEPQREMLAFIKESCGEGHPPTYRDIQEHFGFKSVNAVQDTVRRLMAAGLLEQGKTRTGARRGLMPKGYDLGTSKRLSVVGSIAAGALTESPQTDLGSTFIDASWVKGSSFALRVKGNSMIDAGIYEDDILIVQRGSDARNGDIIVALWEGETTVKRYEKRGGKVFLVPANASMKPIAVERGQLSIQGKVVGLQRKMG
ncbi:MAG: repressor LexA [Deltaproteobacteria bacterium]|nr:repressor LexA [Deltaproteobacteria bacterium]